MVFAEEPPRRIAAPELIAEPAGPGFGIAMGAGRRKFHAAPPGVERVVRPFDVGISSHYHPTIAKADYALFGSLKVPKHVTQKQNQVGRSITVYLYSHI